MKLWILNHYATNMYFDKTGRHQGFAKYLIRWGYDVKIFCAATVHNSDQRIDLGKTLSLEKQGADQVPYVFVKTCDYGGNGLSRIKNMVDYSRRVQRICKAYARKEGKPDVILASSVHPLTLVAGIRLAKAFGIPCICEVRDLWPQSIVEFSHYSEQHPAIRALYRLEKWIYRKADRLIFTMEGGKDYILDKGWTGCVNEDKVCYINNGVDLEVFAENKEKFQLEDADLQETEGYHIIYAGSIRIANKVGQLVDLAQALEEKKLDNLRILVYGDGPDKEKLEAQVCRMGLQNIRFKGRVDKQYIPYILSRPGGINFHMLEKTDIQKYGLSPNKLFEYFAGGNPTLSNIRSGYNLIEAYEAGKIIDLEDAQKAAEELSRFIAYLRTNAARIAENTKRAAADYSLEHLSEKLDGVLKETVAQYSKTKA